MPTPPGGRELFAYRPPGLNDANRGETCLKTLRVPGPRDQGGLAPPTRGPRDLAHLTAAGRGGIKMCSRIANRASGQDHFSVAPDPDLAQICDSKSRGLWPLRIR